MANFNQDNRNNSLSDNALSGDGLDDRSDNNMSVKTMLTITSAALIGGIFITTGIAKLLGVPQMHGAFALMGLPIWFGYVIGALELLGGIGLMLRRWSVLAASGLLGIMMGAIYFHFNFDVTENAIPALVLSAGLFLVIQLRVMNAQADEQSSAHAKALFTCKG